MKVICQQQDLALGLGVIGRAVGKSNTMPVLACVRLVVDAGRLRLAATDLSVGITGTVACQVQEEGGIAVPARLLGDFVSQLPAEPVFLEVDDRTRTLALQCGRYEASIKGLDPAEFPVFPPLANLPPCLELDPARLREALSRVTFAASRENTRPAMTGIDTELAPDKLTFVAADGFRLALHEMPLLQPSQQGPSAVIIPARSMDELIRLLADQEGLVQVYFLAQGNHVCFRCGPFLLVSTLIEAVYPNYAAVIPSSWTTRAVVDAGDFLKAVRVAAFFARGDANIVQLEVQAGEGVEPGKMMVSAESAEVGSTQHELEATVEGPGGKIAFNSRYLAEALQAVGTEAVALEMTVADKPGVLKPVGVNGQLGVLMPMQR